MDNTLLQHGSTHALTSTPAGVCATLQLPFPLPVTLSLLLPLVMYLPSHSSRASSMSLSSNLIRNITIYLLRLGLPPRPPHHTSTYCALRSTNRVTIARLRTRLPSLSTLESSTAFLEEPM